MQFTVLASGSSGNASLLQVDGFGLLLDAGIGPRLLARRLAQAGASWDHVHAALLTHTHSDHWRERTLAQLLRQRIPIYCHLDHHDDLIYSAAFAKMRVENLVRKYGAGAEFTPAPGLTCRPLPLQHDCSTTFGFRFEVSRGEGESMALAYVADLGCWDADLAEALADIDLLALEFNHDVELERRSGRLPDLIERILGDSGHLSNAQAAALLHAILRQSSPGRLQHLVQLHLSRDCNRPEIAREAVAAILAELDSVTLHTASQYEVSPTFVISARQNGAAEFSANAPASLSVATSDFTKSIQPFLPGMGD